MAKKYNVELAGEVMGMTLAEIAEGLGVAKVTVKELEEGKYEGIKLVTEDTTPAPTTEYPEKGSFTDQKLLKKAIKKLSDDQLVEWATLEGLTWKAVDHTAINRMRVAMAINELHFPTERKSSKKSKYADYTTEQLVEMASDNNVEIKPTDDAKILRMRCIMALREAGYIA